jgi:preprotein translocase subunit SecB
LVAPVGGQAVAQAVGGNFWQVAVFYPGARFSDECFLWGGLLPVCSFTQPRIFDYSLLEPNMSDQQQPVFSIEKIYVKDLSLEIPNAPRIFLEREAPEVNVQLHTKGERIDEGMYEVVLTTTVTAKVKEKTMFLVEVQQAGVFQIRHVPETDLDPVLGIAGPTILFPYLRETVSDVVTRAGFHAVILNPVNFEALYHQGKQQADQTAKAETTEDTQKITH